MLSCFFSSSQSQLPLFENSLLTHPDAAIRSLQSKANFYNMIAAASMIAFVALNIFAISYCSLFAVGYLYDVVIAAMIVLPIYSSIVFSPYRSASIEATQASKVELLTKHHLEDLTTHCSQLNPKKKRVYLRSLHDEIGASPLSKELKSYIKQKGKVKDAYETLLPLYARSRAYNDLANGYLREMYEVFLTPAKPLEDRKIEELNYQELLLLYNNPGTPLALKESIDKALHLRETNWVKPENSYLECRMKACEIAAIASHPLHPGTSMGTCRSYTNITEEAAEKSYRKAPSTGAFYIFDHSNTGIDRSIITDAHARCTVKLFYASLYQGIVDGGIKINETDPFGDADKLLSKLKKEFESLEEDPLIEELSSSDWNALRIATKHFLKEMASPNQDGSYNLSEILYSMGWQGSQKSFLYYPVVRNLVHRKTSQELGERLAKNDPYKLENRILSLLFSSLPLHFPKEFTTQDIPDGLCIEGSSYEELLKGASLPKEFTLSNKSLTCARNFLHQLKRKKTLTNSLSFCDIARQSRTLSKYTEKMAKQIL